MSTFSFEYIDRYFRKKDHEDSFHILSDKTCQDLDFEDLFIFLDKTSSRIGQQYLYNKLRLFDTDKNAVQIRENIISHISKNKRIENKVVKSLSKLNKFEAYYLSSLFQDKPLEPPKWFWVVYLFSFLSLTSLILVFFQPQFIALLIAVLVINSGLHYWNKKNVMEYLGSLTQLMKLSNVATKLSEEDIFTPLNPVIRKNIHQINKLRTSIFLFSTESFLQTELGALAWFIYEIIKIIFLLEPILLFRGLKHIQNKKKDIESVFTYIGEIDMVVSIYHWRNEMVDYCIPNISSNNTSIKVTNIYHPFIENCVKNSLDTNNKSILLTGSNMSGKTTFIRTIGINIIMAYGINTCCADSFEIPHSRLYSSIRISDDLLNDKSYYFEEVLSIKEMLKESRETTAPCVFLLDELYKGTNTIERIAAAKSVLSYLAQRNNIVFISTHDIELADLLKGNYSLYHFSEIVNNENVDFDYLLKPGKLTHRNAINILKLNGYPDEIVQEAIQLSHQLSQSK